MYRNILLPCLLIIVAVACTSSTQNDHKPLLFLDTVTAQITPDTTDPKGGWDTIAMPMATNVPPPPITTKELFVELPKDKISISAFLGDKGEKRKPQAITSLSAEERLEVVENGRWREFEIFYSDERPDVMDIYGQSAKGSSRFAMLGIYPHQNGNCIVVIAEGEDKIDYPQVVERTRYWEYNPKTKEWKDWSENVEQVKSSDLWKEDGKWTEELGDCLQESVWIIPIGRRLVAYTDAYVFKDRCGEQLKAAGVESAAEFIQYKVGLAWDGKQFHKERVPIYQGGF